MKGKTMTQRVVMRMRLGVNFLYIDNDDKDVDYDIEVENDEKISEENSKLESENDGPKEDCVVQSKDDNPNQDLRVEFDEEEKSTNSSYVDLNEHVVFDIYRNMKGKMSKYGENKKIKLE